MIHATKLRYPLITRLINSLPRNKRILENEKAQRIQAFKDKEESQYLERNGTSNKARTILDDFIPVYHVNNLFEKTS